MITTTDFIEKVDHITGQQMTDEKANQLSKLYFMIYQEGHNHGYNKCIDETAKWLKNMLWKNPDTDTIECGCMNSSMENFIEDYKRRKKRINYDTRR